MKQVINKIKGNISLTLMGAFIHKSQDGFAERRRIMYSTVCWNLILNLTTMVFLTQYYLALAVSKPDAGNYNIQEFVGNQTSLIAIIASLAGIVQIITPFVLERLTSRKKLLITLRIITHIFNVVLATFLPIFVNSVAHIAPIMIVCYTIMYLSNSFLSPGIMAWQVGNIPKEKQLGFFSLQGLINTVLVGFTLFFSAIVADSLAKIFGAVNAYAIIRTLCLVLVVIDIISLIRLYEPVFKKKKAANSSPKEMLVQFIKNKPYLATIGFLCLWNFCGAIPMQYFIVYMRDDLGVSNSFIQIAQLINLVSVIFLTAFWRKKIAKFGLYKLLSITTALVGIHGLLYCFVNENTYLFMYPIAVSYWYFIYIGIAICFAILPFQHLPEKNRTFFLSMYATCGAVAMFLGNVLGRAINTALGGYITVFNHELAPGQVLYFVFFVTFACAGLIMKFLTKYIKKNEGSLNEG